MKFRGLAAHSAVAVGGKSETLSVADDAELCTLQALHAAVIEHGSSPALEAFIQESGVLSPLSEALCATGDPQVVDVAIGIAMERLKAVNYVGAAVGVLALLSTIKHSIWVANPSLLRSAIGYGVSAAAIFAAHRAIAVTVMHANDLLAVAEDLAPTAHGLMRIVPLTTTLPKTPAELDRLKVALATAMGESNRIIGDHGDSGLPLRQKQALLKLGYKNDTFKHAVQAVNAARPAVLDAATRLAAVASSLDKKGEALVHVAEQNAQARIQLEAVHLLQKSIRHGLGLLTAAVQMVTHDLKTLKKSYTDKDTVDETEAS